jgi:hypothetical protein
MTAGQTINLPGSQGGRMMTEQQPAPIDNVTEVAAGVARPPGTSLYVDRTIQCWIVRDPAGSFWLLPHIEESWKNRQPFQPTDETTLEPVPGHYKCFLGVPQ